MADTTQKGPGIDLQLRPFASALLSFMFSATILG